MKRRLKPRPKVRPMKLETICKDGLATFCLYFGGRRFVLGVHSDKITPQAAIIALDAFTRTLRREFLSGQAHK